jgi:hypothetical protein
MYSTGPKSGHGLGLLKVVGGHRRHAETTAWTGALGPAHGWNGLATRVASVCWCAHMGVVTVATAGGGSSVA